MLGTGQVRRILAAALGAAMLAAGTSALAEPQKAPEPAPWHLGKISKLPFARPDATGESPDKDRPKYLHLQLQFRPEIGDRRLHSFRVTDERGQTVAEPYGFHADRSLVVFEGDWSSLRGLYLEALGHREPLWTEPRTKPAARAPEKATSPPPAPEKEDSPWEIDPADKSPAPQATDAGRSAAPATGPGGGSAGSPGGSDGGSGGGSGGGGSGGGTGGGTGGGGGGSGAGSGPAAGMSDGAAAKGGRVARVPRDTEIPPWVRENRWAIYLSCATEYGRGRIYQVDEDGTVQGLVTLPHAATGLAMHRRPALVAAVPRDRGQILQIDESARVSVLLEGDPLLLRPVDVAVAGNSDTIVAADNLRHLLATTSINGEKAKVYRRFEHDLRDRPMMSVAAAMDDHVLLGADKEPGIYRFGAGAKPGQLPLLPHAGGVAADTASRKWAAAQPPDELVVCQGNDAVKSLHLPAGRAFFRDGLLSFAPGESVVVAVRPKDDPSGQVWLVKVDTKDGAARVLFPWKREPIADLVVGPPMPWERPKKLRSLY
jgi:hypothetical protein